jgi:signal transduction histidine kinase
VTDDGPGIPEAERRAILSGEEQPLYHASGLGVWFVKWAVRLVGGELDIADNEPRGTVVTLRLPTHPTVESTTATGDAGADAD